MNYLTLMGLFGCLLGLTAERAFAADRTCASLYLSSAKIEQGNENLICGEIEAVPGEENLFRIKNLEQLVGDGMSDQVLITFSKHKICEKLLWEAGLSAHGRYVRKSMMTWGRAMRTTAVPTIEEITCRAK